MARDMVGDGRKPNRYFVTDGGRVVLVTTDRVAAYRHWVVLARRRPLAESALEDRLFGVIASVSPDSDAPGARLEVLNDMDRRTRREAERW